MVRETYLILATGKIHSEIRDESGSNGRIKFRSPLSSLGCLGGGKPLKVFASEDKMELLTAKEIENFLKDFEEDQRITIQEDILEFPFVLYWHLMTESARN